MVVAVVLLGSDPLAAQETAQPALSGAGEAEAKLHYQKATAAYALGDFVEAARQYEAAFRLKLDAALLFNAAQAHRRAGNRQRAIELYENLLRVFPAASGRQMARQHLQDLRRSLASDPPAAGGPPTGAPPPPLERQEGPADLPSPPDRPPPPSPIYRRVWFWAGVAVVVLAGAATVAALSLDDREARPSWGRVGP
jgi:tetratricopeptide (TPR) repeat protein